MDARHTFMKNTPRSRAVCSAFAFLTLLSTAPAFGQINWTNDAGDNNFANGLNWDPVNTPFSGSNREYDVNKLGADRAVLSSDLGNLQRDLRIGDNNGQGEFEITAGGILNVTRNMRLGRGGDGVTGFGIATVDGGILAIDNHLFVGQSDNAGNLFTLNAGSVTVGSELNVATNNTTQGTLNITGGTLSAGQGDFADHGSTPTTANLNISGNGELTTSGRLSFANGNGGATATVSLSDNASLSAGTFTRFGGGTNSVSSLTISDNASLTATTSAQFGFGENSTTTLDMSGGTLNALTSFLTFGQNADSEVTVNMSGGTINTDRLAFAGEATSGDPLTAGTATLNMSGGEINVVAQDLTNSGRGGFRLGSAGAVVNLSGDAVVNAERLRINAGGSIDIADMALINITGSTVETSPGSGVIEQPTFDFAQQFFSGNWNEVGGTVNFSTMNTSRLQVAGENEMLFNPFGAPVELNFVELFNAAIENGVFTTAPSGGFNVGFDGTYSFVTAVPEPSSHAILGLVCCLLTARRSRRR